MKVYSKCCFKALSRNTIQVHPGGKILRLSRFEVKNLNSIQVAKSPKSHMTSASSAFAASFFGRSARCARTRERNFERFILDNFKLTVATVINGAEYYVSERTNAGKNHFHPRRLGGLGRARAHLESAIR